MSERGITPEWFANALRTLEARSPASTDPGNASAYISTHPASQQRIDAALDAARGFDPLEVIVAKQMAESEGAGETLDAARVAGCWIGKRPTGEKRFSQWEVSFGEDGAVAAHFLVLDGNDSILESTSNTGRWAWSGDVMTVRLLTEESRFGSRAVDDLQSYVIHSLTDDALYYESLKTEIYFESQRIDCAKLSFNAT